MDIHKKKRLYNGFWYSGFACIKNHSFVILENMFAQIWYVLGIFVLLPKVSFPFKTKNNTHNTTIIMYKRVGDVRTSGSLW